LGPRPNGAFESAIRSRLPNPVDEEGIHRRILAGEAEASADLFNRILRPVVARLQWRWPADSDAAYDAAVDAFLGYLNRPSSCVVSKGRLSTFLSHIARLRLIDRHRAAVARADRERKFVSAVELGPAAPNMLVERKLEVGALWAHVQTILDDKDREALKLILFGERSTRVLAEAFGISRMFGERCSAEVKRRRDRLMKTLRRFGRQLQGHTG